MSIVNYLRRMRYFIRLRYKGKLYHGWQFQKNAPSVQEVVDEKLSMVLREKIETLGCGRTDTGVHAEDFYAHFETINEIKDIPALLDKLASLRVPGVQFRGICRVDARLHARFDALSRTYEYRIARDLNPFLKGLTYYMHGDLDLKLMRKVSTQLLGKRDFGAFSKAHSQSKTNICTITNADWEEKDDMLIFRITADRFLRNMVRAIVGTLLEIGQKKRPADDLLRVMNSGTRSDAGVSVPACGLFLTEVIYPEGSFSF